MAKAKFKALRCAAGRLRFHPEDVLHLTPGEADELLKAGAIAPMDAAAKPKTAAKATKSPKKTGAKTTESAAEKKTDD